MIILSLLYVCSLNELHKFVCYAYYFRTQILKRKPGEDGSDALIDMINRAQDDQKTDVVELVGEKFERRLSEEIAGVNHRIEQLRTKFKEDNANLRTEMHTLRADLIKWMFIFWIGQVAAILGILFAFFR